MTDTPELGMTLEATCDAIAKGEVSVEALARATLEKLATIGTELNAVARTEDESALASAVACDRQRAAGASLPPLFGAPLAHKDIYEREGWLCEAGSQIMQGRAAERTAFACKQLDMAGALDLARLNTVEFALGTTGHNSITGAVKNPWNPAHITGGSSSGSGAMVAAGVVPAALGTDTGGSVRLPAAACGLVGLKPTLGRVGRSGVVPLSHSLDTVGPLTRTVRDAALMLRVLAGYDPSDAGSADLPVHEYMATIEAGASGMRIGLPRDVFFDGLDDDVASLLDGVRSTIAGTGATVSDVAIENVALVNRLTTLIIAVEGSAAHSRWLTERANDYGPQTLGRLMTGLFVSADAYVRTLEFRRRFAQNTLDTVFHDVDLLLTPVWPYAIPTIEASDVGGNPGFTEMVVASGQCTRPVNFLGFPSITVPCGLTSNGLPVAFQLVARPFEEALLLQAARAFEREMDFASAKPQISVW